MLIESPNMGKQDSVPFSISLAPLDTTSPKNGPHGFGLGMGNKTMSFARQKSGQEIVSMLEDIGSMIGNKHTFNNLTTTLTKCDRLSAILQDREKNPRMRMGTLNPSVRAER